MKPMPKYRSHKEVQALKILAISTNPDGSATITPAEDGYDPFEVSAAYITKHQPEPGGYFVQYADNYVSFSPAKAFEEGYTRVS